ncbi:hypothetical protein, partial [Thiothrix sp. UBA2016]|uniref:hypothetical protein n=1 Tax=Thiothrix sp. UBA2016 TaxID=1947695 RepID=UPI0025F93C02
MTTETHGQIGAGRRADVEICITQYLVTQICKCDGLVALGYKTSDHCATRRHRIGGEGVTAQCS